MTKIADLYNLAEELDARISAIVKNPKFKSGKQNNIRIRLAWKELFAKYNNYESHLTANAFQAFNRAVSYTIDEMSTEDTIKYIDVIIEFMKEVSTYER